MKQDPYMLKPEAAKGYADKNSGGGSAGIFCPKRNVNMNGECRVCKAVQPLWSYPKGSKERNKAADKGPKQNFYMNVVLPSNPNKRIVLEVGSKAGNAILDGIIDTEKGWTDIAHPKKGLGREIKIKKHKDGEYNAYDVFIAKDKADYDIPDEVLKNLPDLDNIIEMLKSGEFNEENFMRISSLKMDETGTFRVCPPSNMEEKGPEALPLVAVWRHWNGVTQAEVDGEVPVSLWDEKKEDEKIDDTPFAPEKTSEVREPVTDTKPPCFGKSFIFDENHPDCIACTHMSDCGRAALKG